MKTYLIEYKDVNYIVRAKSKIEASFVVEEEYQIMFIPVSCIKKLPKQGVIYKHHENT